MSSLAPRALQIDASSTCQLACPVCPTADGRTRPVLGRGHLKVEDFEALLDGNPELLQVELSNYGEMFLNPQLPRLLEAAYRRGVVISGNNGVNLNFAREEALEAVVRYRVRALTCSIDGATPATYAQYRRNGDLNNVLRNIDRILEHKRRLGTEFPLLYWQFVVFGHNEHELELARAMAAERGMEFVPRISWDAEHSPVKDTELVNIQTGLGAATRDEFKQTQGHDYTRDICFQLWQAPVVNWDGKLLGCCVNYWGDFGANVFAEGLAASAESLRMQQARAMLTGESGPVEGVPCTTCDQYHSVRDSGDWLTEHEIDAHPKQEYLVSLRLTAPDGMRFARVNVVPADAEPVRSPTTPAASGRVFRFGVDRAVLAKLPGPGAYRAEIEVLKPGGWWLYPVAFSVPERPICYEVTLDLATAIRSERLVKPQTAGAVPAWIR